MSRRPFKARTADGPMMFPALEMSFGEQQRITTDPDAVRRLPPAVRLTVRAMAWRPLRSMMARALDKQTPGLWGGMVARKRYTDDEVADALAAGIGQFVILGAGFDTRAFRLIAPAGATAFEVDLPENSVRKAKLLQRLFGRVPERVELVGMDLETDDLWKCLVAQGFTPELPAMFVMEAVTQYLQADAVDRVFTALAKACPSSRLAFTYIRSDFLAGTRLYGWDRAYKQWVVQDKVWRFGLSPAAVGDFLRRYGWAEREQVGFEEYAARYFRPAGRHLAAIDIERFVAAEKID
ncbi:MAG TPA: SAM-dependent methyltransferase [Mycobacterium sp.]|nr:SAM-dependent methyltransferase [Mycobacterium sp.]